MWNLPLAEPDAGRRMKIEDNAKLPHLSSPVRIGGSQTTWAYKTDLKCFSFEIQDMEQSDSDNFESADEDLSSSDFEEETEKSIQSIRKNISLKNIEPEVCKLKHDERTKDISEGNVGVVDDVKNDKSPSNSEDSTVNLGSVTTKCDNKNIVEISRCDTNENNIENSPKEVETILVKNDNEKVDNPATSIEISKDLPPVSQSKQDVKTNVLSQIVEVNIKSKQKSTLTETEDNLWDDDEIDWESEGVKEETQKTKNQSSSSKNEDSGWDDFDAGWESESPLSPEENSKTEHVHPKSTALSVGDNKKVDIASPDEENLWGDDDDWEPLEKPEDKPKQPEEQSGWGGWGSWDVSSLLNTATQGVSTLTSQVSHGLSTVLESSIGIPDPEDLAKMNKLETEGTASTKSKKEDLKQVSDDSSAFGLDNLVSGMSQLTKFVESTGTKVITGGLDTLEAIGKKTVEVLQEGDPGLKKKRAFLKLDTGKPNLSQILREAKEKAEEENNVHQQKYIDVKRTKNYEALFDDHQGLVHLEALEMLSRLCSMKLGNLTNSLHGNALKEMQETLEQVKELCELPEDDEEEKISLEEGRETITNAVKEIGIPISYDKLFATSAEADAWLTNVNLDFMDDTDLHQQAIETLAQLTALAVEQFHKAGELLMVKDHRSTADEADSLVQITSTVKSLILGQAGKFSDKLSSIKNANKDNISEHITNIFYEAGNSGSYIQDAFQLLIPVLQVGAV